MEAAIGDVPEMVPAAFDFSLQSERMASFILDRKMTTWFPQGAATYSSANTRVIRFHLSDSSGYYDVNSTKLCFTIHNTHPARELLFAGNPNLLFSRLRVLLSGSVCEDQAYYNRTYALEHSFTPDSRLKTELIETQWDVPILHGESRRMTISLNSGLLTCGRALPLRWIPTSLELELTTQGSDAFCPSHTPSGGTATLRNQTDFELRDVRLLCDILTIAPNARNHLDEFLLGGGSLALPYSTWITSAHQPAQETAFAIQTTRSLTRLRGVFVTFYREWTGANTLPASGAYTGSTNRWTPVTTRYHPLEGQPTDSSATDIMSWRVSVGSKLLPEHEVVGTGESYMRLLQTLDQLVYGEPGNIDPVSWRRDKFCIAVDCERSGGSHLGASFSGLSLRTGDPVRLEVKNWTAGRFASQAYIHLQADVLVSWSASGAILQE